MRSDVRTAPRFLALWKIRFPVGAIASIGHRISGVLLLLALPGLALTFALSFGALAATGPYDEAADAKAQIASAVADAARAKMPVLVVFGANWCGDCKVLDLAFKEGAAAPLIAKHFNVVKVNVGRFDKNVAVAKGYGVPLKNGIPAIAVLSPEGRVVYATKAGELADARKMGDKGIYDFFVRVSGTAAR